MSRIPLRKGTADTGAGPSRIPVSRAAATSTPFPTNVPLKKTVTRTVRQLAPTGEKKVRTISSSALQPPGTIPGEEATAAPRVSRIPSGLLHSVRTQKTTTTDPKTGQKKLIVKTTKTYKVPEAPEPPQTLPPGQYMIQARPRADLQAGLPLSSPKEMRSRLEDKMPIELQRFSNVPKPGTYVDYRKLKQKPQFLGGTFRVDPRGPAPTAESYFATESAMDNKLDGEESMDWGSSISSTPEPDELEVTVHQELMDNIAKHPGTPARAVGSQRSRAPPITIDSPSGETRATHQIIVEETIDRASGRDLVNTRVTALHPGKSRQWMNKIEVDSQDLRPTSSEETARDIHEIISTTSSVTVGPGVQKVVKTVRREARPAAASADYIDPKEVMQMIAEENRDIERISGIQTPALKTSSPTGFAIKRRAEQLQLNPSTLGILEQSLAHGQTVVEIEDEIEPEVVTRILSAEERGLGIASNPENVCDYLFDQYKEEPLIQISSVTTRYPLSDVVVPVNVSETAHNADVSAELEETVTTRKFVDIERNKPTDNIYALTLGRKQGGLNVSRTAKRPLSEAPIISDESPPMELQDISELIGALPKDEKSFRPEFELIEEEENQFEYFLQPEVPTFRSMVQLRGTQKPFWFPGYYVALPDIAHTIKVLQSPSTVLIAAKRSLQPNIFADESSIVFG